MSKYISVPAVAGIPQITQSFDDDATKRATLGLIVTAVDQYWGGGEFIYCNFASTVRNKGLVTITPTFDSANNRWLFTAVEVANTANLGRMLGVAVMSAASGEYGWVQISGMTPVNCQAAVAADTTFGIAAAGQGGANSAGKQVLSARIHGASTITVAKTATKGVIGGDTIQVNNTDGWFVGGYLSGTGIGAAAIITSISTDEKTVGVSVVNSAAVTGSITCTYNNGTIFYNVALLNRPFAQGAIT